MKWDRILSVILAILLVLTIYLTATINKEGKACIKDPITYGVTGIENQTGGSHFACQCTMIDKFGKLQQANFGDPIKIDPKK